MEPGGSRSKAREIAAQEWEHARVRPGVGQEQGKSRAGAFYFYFFANISSYAMFHWQEQGRSREGAGQKQVKSRA